MATKQQTLKLDFLYQLSHNILFQCPELSSFYRSSFQHTLKEADVVAEKKISKEACPRCGQIYLSGLNTSVTLKHKIKSHKKKEKQLQQTTKSNKPNVLIYTCHTCQYQRKFNGSFKKLIPVVDTPIKNSNTSNKTTTTINNNKDNKNINNNDNNTKISKTINNNNNNVNIKKNDSTAKPISVGKNLSINSSINNNNNNNNSNSNNNNNKNKNNSMNSNNNKKNQQQQKRPMPPSNQQQLSNKKSKKNQLQNLIANRKKDQQGGNGGGGGLGLNDFLSQL